METDGNASVSIFLVEIIKLPPARCGAVQCAQRGVTGGADFPQVDA